MVRVVGGKKMGGCGSQLLMLVRTLKSQCKEIMGSIVRDMVEMVI
jgi:hypothetical protein